MGSEYSLGKIIDKAGTSEYGITKAIDSIGQSPIGVSAMAKLKKMD